VFACILIRPWDKIWLYGIQMPALIYAVIFMVYSIYMAKRGGDNVNHDAHLWGAAFGVVFTLLVDHEVFGNFINSLIHPNF
jgi:membrane associated rhomboid family serine protease